MPRVERVMLPATGNVEQYITVERAAAMKEVSKNAIYKAIDAGRLTFYGINKHGVLKVSDVDAYVPLRAEDRAGAKLKTWRPIEETVQSKYESG